MPEEKEIKNSREPGLCVIRDDDHGWGGPDPDIEPEQIKKIKKVKNIDEPMNWPFSRYRS